MVTLFYTKIHSEFFIFLGVALHYTIHPIKMELQYFKDNYQDLPFIFTKAFIGDKDKIIPAYKQKKLFIKKNIPVYKLSTGHYLWHKINNWQYFMGEHIHEF
ncbi:MAG: hypothetical protein ACLTXK_08470 [Megamonas funiformis]